jgi:transcription termination factor Rho
MDEKALNAAKVTELRVFADEAGVENYQKMRKAELVEAILDKIVDHISLLSTVNTVLGALVGVIITAVLLFAVGSVAKFFFAEQDFYLNSVLLKFFGESSILETLKILDIGSLLK